MLGSLATSTRRHDPSPENPSLEAPPRQARPRIYIEILLVFVCYRAYSFVRAQVPEEREAALQRARDILHVEELLFLDIERGLNRLFLDVSWLGTLANSHYTSLHFVMTIGVLVWLYVWRPAHYLRCRRLLMATTLVGLAGFWLYPLAPPRMLPGFTDTALVHGGWGMYDTSTPVGAITNQYAAMPSLHTAWSLWCAIAIISVCKSWRIGVIAALYPASTIIVIMGTANHFILDAVGGAAALALGFALVLSLARCRGPAMRLITSPSAAGRS